MKIKYAILVFFIVISLTLVGISLYQSNLFDSSESEAGGFGLGSPYVTHNGLKPGESFTKTISVLRSRDDIVDTVKFTVADEELANWLSFSPISPVTLAIGSLKARVNVTVTVPEDARPGIYTGTINFYQVPNADNPGVSIALGARADINLVVLDSESAVSNDRLPLEILFLEKSVWYNKYQGRVLIKTEDNNQSFYIHASEPVAYFLEEPEAVPAIIKETATGISNTNLEAIPVGLDTIFGEDTDGDGLPDEMETALGTDPFNRDTDMDRYNDFMEISNGYNPNGTSTLSISFEFTRAHLGKIFLQVEDQGQAWYIDPNKERRYFLGNSEDAFFVLRQLGQDISNQEFSRLINRE